MHWHVNFLSDVSHLFFCNAVTRRAEARGRQEEEKNAIEALLDSTLFKVMDLFLLTKLNSIIGSGADPVEKTFLLSSLSLPLVWKIPVQEEKAMDFNLPFLLIYA
uniref:Uncharacterized protein n=1 Tax=Sphaerodactylus townsendi TaxID=933632 RepID=A0ACB8GAP5_9SAUR